MPMIIKKAMTNDICIFYKKWILFHNHLGLNYKSFHYILQLAYQLVFFYT